MKKIILILVLLTTGVAMGQSLQDQKACYNEAQKHYIQGFNTVSNYFDGKTSTCWVRINQYQHNGNGAFITVGNVFENQSAAIFNGPESEDLKPTDDCVVDGIQCHSLDEFNKLVKTHYPGL